MQVLYYNWVDYLDPAGRGGGVSVYQRNLIAALAEAAPAITPAFLSSGMAHDLTSRRPRWRARPRSGGAARYEIVNSGLLSPAHADFASPAQTAHAPTEAAFADFLARTGPYGVIHLNGLEGIPAGVLALKAQFPATRLILSLHNYYPFCPQVNLWREERMHCSDFAEGHHCVTCLPLQATPAVVRKAYGVETLLGRINAGPGTALYGRVFLPLMQSGWRLFKRLAQARRTRRADAVPAAPKPAPETEAAPRTAAGATPAAPARAATPAQSPPPGPQPGPQPASQSAYPSGPPPESRAAHASQAAAFARRRRTMVALINAHCDQVLCVSGRVRAIAQHHGIRPELLRTSYIGTQQAGAWARTAPRDSFLDADGTLQLAYLGYMRADKGFFFLLDALEALPDAMAARLHLTVAAQARDSASMDRLRALAPRLAGLRHLDGYSHAGLDDLLAGTGLGLVPVLWEDNLPQVAVEMHARHIPLLCADRGGARELGRCDALVFRAGDTADFARALGRVLDCRITPADYFARAMAPVDMDTHLAELLAVYRGQG